MRDSIFAIILFAGLVCAFYLGQLSVSPIVASELQTIPEVNISENPASLGHIMEVKDAVRQYYYMHTPLNGTFDCKFMAMDFWNVLYTDNIHAEIMIGDVDNELLPSIREANHAWVIAEVSPGEWLAVDPTKGYIICNEPKVCPISNPLYYRGFVFSNPTEFARNINWRG